MTVRYFSADQLGERYGVDGLTVLAWVRRGRYPEPVRLPGGFARWPEEQVAAWDREMVDRAAAPKGRRRRAA